MNELPAKIPAFSNDKIAVLKDGRDLSFVTSGRPDGIPIFFFHGTPGSRFASTSEDRFAVLPGVFMIFPERPGYGLSTPKGNRALADWADDVIELADHLGIDRFAVAGGSGGGPHALACAWKYPERVFSAFVFASPTPIRALSETKGMVWGNRLNFYLGTKMPWLVRFLMRSAAATVLRDPEKYLRSLAKQMGPADRAILENEDYRAAIVKDLHE